MNSILIQKKSISIKLKLENPKDVVICVTTLKENAKYFAFTKGKYYMLLNKKWEKMDYDPINQRTLWEYQKKLISALISDLHDGKKLDWFFPTNDKQIKNVDLFDKKTVINYTDGSNFTNDLSDHDLKQFSDYPQMIAASNKVQLKIPFKRV